MAAPLEITDVTIHPIPTAKRTPGDPLLGFARVTLNGVFVVSSIKIVEGRLGRKFIAWPRERVRRGDAEPRNYNVAFPITKAVQEAFSDRILAAYQEAIHG